jgi:hypothetical protein
LSEELLSPGPDLRKEKVMKKHTNSIALAFLLLSAGAAAAQDFPIMDIIADKVIQKYQGMTCEQLWQQKSQPKPPMEENVVTALKNDPQMRQEFINKVAPTIVNKMFDCGMIP